jgi:class 3 adenylate cyclase
VGASLRRLATKGNILYIFDANHHDLIATSLSVDRLAFSDSVINADGEREDTLWQVPNTPDAEVNNGALLILESDNQDQGTLALDDIIVSYKQIKINTLQWIVVDHTPRDYYFGEARRLRDILIGIASAVIVVCLAVCVVVYFAVVRPIGQMSSAMDRVSRLERANLSEGADGPALAELRPIHDAFVKLDLAMQSFTRYVPRGVVKELIESNQLCQLAMAPRNCSILFADIAGFTTLSERVPAADLSRLIHTYFSRMSQIVMHHNGIIDKFIGDCIMAVWGAPFPQENHELRATLCAMLMDHESRSPPLTTQFGDVGEVLSVRVGVNSGDVLAGNMGSDDRMNYTVIGDPVNLAARLEAFNRQMGTRVMVSEFVANHLQSKVCLRLLCRVSVVGKSQPVCVFEPRGVNPHVSDFVADVEVWTTTPLHIENNGTTLAPDGDEIRSLSGDYVKSDCPSKMNKGPEADRERHVKSLLRQARKTIQCSQEDAQFTAQYSDAVQSFIAGEFGETLQQCEELQRLYGQWTNDKAFEYLHETASKCLKNKPTDFDGVFRASEK